MSRPKARLSTLVILFIGAGLFTPGPTKALGQDNLTPADIEDLQRQVLKLMSMIQAQKVEIDVLREQLAESQFNANQNEDELSELKEFIEDYHKMGDTFEEYQSHQAEAKATDRKHEIQDARDRHTQIKAERRKRFEAALEVRRERKAEQKRLAQFRAAGFSPIGLDVFASTFSFFYNTSDTTRSRIAWRSGFGHYLRLYPNHDIDFSNMTISGSVLNAFDETRNIGIAITFFDEFGTQVGHEIIQVDNARPDVPYPFTAELKMALNRPFETSSTYVLYADPIDLASKPAPTSP
ncbi:MAG: hypothetical protein O7G85_07320 [Planctomycetota bacterium]|nr:hypothetical protein [Planctomycetota bacterium]